MLSPSHVGEPVKLFLQRRPIGVYALWRISIISQGEALVMALVDIRIEDEVTPIAILYAIYPAHPIIRYSFGSMTRKLSVTSSQ
jgi:hypothetical protein